MPQIEEGMTILWQIEIRPKQTKKDPQNTTPKTNDWTILSL